MFIQRIISNGTIEGISKFTRKLAAPVADSVMDVAGTKYAHNLEADVVQISEHIGKHKIPRFIYHFTNKQNYESMLRDGAIIPDEDGYLGAGVFAVELANLFKKWSKTIGVKKSLLEELINHAAKYKDEVVILKIPTEKLDPELLQVRSQNTLIKYDNYESEISYTKRKLMSETDTGLVMKLKKHLAKIQSKAKNIEKHVLFGAPAKDSNLFKQRKDAIEYIYLDDIPMSNVEKIGEVNIRKLLERADYNPAKPMKSFFASLLKGTPEVKGAELLNC